MAYDKKYIGEKEVIKPYLDDREDRIEKEFSNVAGMTKKIRVITQKLSGTSATIQYGSDWAGSVLLNAFVKHPTGGHWVGTVSLRAMTMNPNRTNCSITVDGYYADQDILLVIGKE